MLIFCRLSGRLLTYICLARSCGVAKGCLLQPGMLLMMKLFAVFCGVRGYLCDRNPTAAVAWLLRCLLVNIWLIGLYAETAVL